MNTKKILLSLSPDLQYRVGNLLHKLDITLNIEKDIHFFATPDLLVAVVLEAFKNSDEELEGLMATEVPNEIRVFDVPKEETQQVEKVLDNQAIVDKLSAELTRSINEIIDKFYDTQREPMNEEELGRFRTAMYITNGESAHFPFVVRDDFVNTDPKDLWGFVSKYIHTCEDQFIKEINKYCDGTSPTTKHN